MSTPESQPFDLRRRQQLLDKHYYLFVRDWVSGHTSADIESALERDTLSNEMRWLEQLRKAGQLFEMLSLDYTAGCPIGELRERFGVVVQAYEEAALFNRVHEN